MKRYYIYIMASERNGTDLPKRTWEHKEGIIQGFTKDHQAKILVWFEETENIESAIIREK